MQLSFNINAECDLICLSFFKEVYICIDDVIIKTSDVFETKILLFYMFG